MKKAISVVLACAMLVGLLPVTAAAEEPAVTPVPLKAWYTESATDWASEATPLGNGYLGAMVFGGVDSDHIQINEHTLWSGGPGADENYNGGHVGDSASAHTALNEVRAGLQEKVTKFTEESSAYIDSETGEIIAKDYAEDTEEFNNKLNTLKGSMVDMGAYQPLGDLYIESKSSGKIVKVSSEASKATDASQSVGAAFDKSLNTKWYSISGTPEGTTQDFPVDAVWEYETAEVLTGYNIVSGGDAPGRDPKNWTISGSNDGETYTELAAETNQTFESRKQSKTYTMENTTAYKFYKLLFADTATSGNALQIQEIEPTVEEQSAGPVGEPTNYKRTLDIDNAIAQVEYEQDGTKYLREYFVSYPGNFMAIRLTADKTASITRTISVETLQTATTITAENDTITMTGSPADHDATEKLKFAQQVKVIPTGGTMTVVGNKIQVTSANSVLILMSAGTNYQLCMDNTFDYFKDGDPLDAVKARIAAAAAIEYDTLKATHVADYSALFDRMSFQLDGAVLPDKPTDELLAAYGGRTGSPNTPEEDRYLEILYFQFGRYQLISSSRPGTLPANLQGIWCDQLNPAWRSDYHTNINLQMNYWAAEQTNLSECHLPVIEFTNSFVPRGKITAQHYFVKPDGGAVRGWTVGHENNIWGKTAPSDYPGTFYFPAGAAWMCQDIWEHYDFTRDKTFPADNYNTMLEASLFWVDSLWTDTRDNTLVANPSYSPEHGTFSLGSGADQSIIWDSFENTIRAAEVLGKGNDAEILEIKAAQDKLAGPKIGLAGELLEWKDELKMDLNGDGGHRHTNHLFSLFPGKQIISGRSDEDDALAQAAKETLRLRKLGGDSDQTGWSHAWAINLFARIQDGASAFERVQTTIMKKAYPNLFNFHPPFQIDGNLGATAGVSEMLLQSPDGYITILPALPTQWADGSFAGMRARGNFTISAIWTGGSADKITVEAGTTGPCNLRYYDISKAVIQDEDGAKVIPTIVSEDRVHFDAVKGKTYTLTNLPESIPTSNPVAFLGGVADDIYDNALVRKTGKTDKVGAYLERVGTLTATDGFQRYDVICAANGLPVTNATELSSVYASFALGEQISFNVWRATEYLTLTHEKVAREFDYVLPAKLEAEKAQLVNCWASENVEGSGAGTGVGYTTDASQLIYKNVYFESKPDQFEIRASGGDGQTPIITVRSGSASGPILAQLPVAPTGSWGTYAVKTTSFTGEDLTGKSMDIYICLGAGANIDWISFTNTEPKHTVIFRSNGGTYVPAQRNVATGAVVTAPTPPTHETRIFGGWYADEALETPWDFATTVTANTTLYAKWTKSDAELVAEAKTAAGSGILLSKADYADNTAIAAAATTEVQALITNGVTATVTYVTDHFELALTKSTATETVNPYLVTVANKTDTELVAEAKTLAGTSIQVPYGIYADEQAKSAAATAAVQALITNGVTAAVTYATDHFVLTLTRNEQSETVTPYTVTIAAPTDAVLVAEAKALAGSGVTIAYRHYADEQAKAAAATTAVQALITNGVTATVTHVTDHFELSLQKNTTQDTVTPFKVTVAAATDAAQVAEAKELVGNGVEIPRGSYATEAAKAAVAGSIVRSKLTGDVTATVTYVQDHFVLTLRKNAAYDTVDPFSVTVQAAPNPDTGSGSGSGSSVGNKPTTNPDGSVTTEKIGADGARTSKTTYTDGTKVVAVTTKTGVTTATVTLPAGKEHATVTVPVANTTAGTVAIIVHADGTEEIVKNSVATKGGLKVSLEAGATLKIVDNAKPFADVHKADWHDDAVAFVTARELFSGTAKDTFSPYMSMTRGMLTTVLQRLSGDKIVAGETWYSASVDWAKGKGISDGSNPNEDISREELAVMLYRYAGKSATAAELSGYADGSDVSAWATEAMSWAVTSGVIRGNEMGQLAPKATASRAEVATMLQRMVTATI